MQFVFKYTWGIWRQSQWLLSNERKKVEASKAFDGEQGKFLAGEWVDPAINREYFPTPGGTTIAGFILLEINKQKRRKRIKCPYRITFWKPEKAQKHASSLHANYEHTKSPCARQARQLQGRLWNAVWQLHTRASSGFHKTSPSVAWSHRPDLREISVLYRPVKYMYFLKRENIP